LPRKKGEGGYHGAEGGKGKNEPVIVLIREKKGLVRLGKRPERTCGKRVIAPGMVAWKKTFPLEWGGIA